MRHLEEENSRLVQECASVAVDGPALREENDRLRIMCTEAQEKEAHAAQALAQVKAELDEALKKGRAVEQDARYTLQESLPDLRVQNANILAASRRLQEENSQLRGSISSEVCILREALDEAAVQRRALETRSKRQAEELHLAVKCVSVCPLP